MLEELKEQVCNANMDLARYGLATLTWGNASGIVRSEGLVVIKPSGVDYASLTPADMVIVDLENNIVEGSMRPSSDTKTHTRLYSAFPGIGGIAHTHSVYATMFAQACRPISCLGTTHADHFSGPIPVTRFLTGNEVSEDYEGNTGAVIVEAFAGVDPLATPGVLVAGHAPFAFGRNVSESVENALVLERVAQMALGSLQLNPSISRLPSHIESKHYQRKHGPQAYYGQKNKKEKR